MSIIVDQDQFAEAQILDFVIGERNKALSRREWKHRLAGFGYSIRETEAGDIVETMLNRVKVCILPTEALA
ncbi:MAG: hypothetical protein ABJX32_03685 [Tateyamaria sp.]|uniref:hypothetical protein n=1 Tax=Tateyamaria sp. TaxID=1929288 RepID=UPI00329C2B1D